MEARLPDEKLTEIQDLLKDLLAAQYTTVGEFESFLGKLTFASRVVVPGRTFMRQIVLSLEAYGELQARPLVVADPAEALEREVLLLELHLDGGHRHWPLH